jgi:cation diffusion facilitator family transporter
VLHFSIGPSRARGVLSGCGCSVEIKGAAETRVLWIALVLNALMAVVGLAAGWWADSAGLLADALDMLTDASSYAIGLLAIGRSPVFKARAATATGVFLLGLGIGLLIEVGRRAIYGSEPLSLWMIAIAALSLAVNVTVLKLLHPFREGEVHLRATWICTRADVVANLGVILSGALVALTGARYPDLIVGAAIAMYVIKEAFQILSEAKVARHRVSAGG